MIGFSEPRSRGFSLRGFSHWVNFGCDPFQPVHNRSVGVVCFLVPDVFDDPRQIFRSKAHDTVAGLPLDCLAALPLIDLMGGSTLQLANQFADPDRRRQCHRQMDVRWRAADFVNESARQADEARGVIPDG